MEGIEDKSGGGSIEEELRGTITAKQESDEEMEGEELASEVL